MVRLHAHFAQQVYGLTDAERERNLKFVKNKPMKAVVQIDQLATGAVTLQRSQWHSGRASWKQANVM